MVSQILMQGYTLALFNPLMQLDPAPLWLPYAYASLCAINLHAHTVSLGTTVTCRVSCMHEHLTMMIAMINIEVNSEARCYYHSDIMSLVNCSSQ